MTEQFGEHILQMLRLGQSTLKDNPQLTEETGVTNAKGDKSIAMDVKIEELFIDYIKKHNLPVNIFSEEVGTVKFHPNPTHLIAFDPLDGSTNYKIGNGLFPYGILIACYKGIEPKLGDAIAAGAIEQTHNLGWLYKDDKTTDLEGNIVHLKSDWKPHRSTPVYLDLYYEEGYKAYSPLAQRLFIRNQGSTIGNLSYVLSNVAAGLGGVCMRAEEIGAVVALIKGVGGLAVNHQGVALAEQPFNPQKTYQIIAGSPTIVEFALNYLQ